MPPEWIKYNSMEVNSGLQTVRGCACCVPGMSQDSLARAEQAYQTGGMEFQGHCVQPPSLRLAFADRQKNPEGLILI